MGRARQLAEGGINDAILMDASAADTDVNDNLLLEGTDSDSADAGFNLLYEDGTHDGSAMLSNTHLADITSPVRSAGRSITLPDVSEPILTDDDNHIQQFRITSDLAYSTATALQNITANIEAVDSRSLESKGSLISQSSGVFSFSETGYYKVTCAISIKGYNYTAYGGGGIQTTPDNSTYSKAAEGFEHTALTSTGTVYSQINVDANVKVTDISNQKVKFYIISNNSNMTIQANTDANQTYFEFQRIGDI